MATLRKVILHRTKSHIFDFTTRASDSEPWSNASATGIQDARSNLNAGKLPDGRIFLVSNACTEGRDPLVSLLPSRFMIDMEGHLS